MVGVVYHPPRGGRMNGCASEVWRQGGGVGAPGVWGARGRGRQHWCWRGWRRRGNASGTARERMTTQPGRTVGPGLLPAVIAGGVAQDEQGIDVGPRPMHAGAF